MAGNSEDLNMDVNDGTVRGETRITGLNDQCLETMMDCMKLEDLVSTAASNTRFTDTAEYVFRHRHADKMFRFVSSEFTDEMCANFLKILDQFGKLMQKISVVLSVDRECYERDDNIVKKINEKCINLIELSLSCMCRNIVLSQPFLQLRKLTIIDSVFNDSLANLVVNAPSLAALEFHNVENVFKNNGILNVRFPSLVHFGNYNQVVENPELELENLQNFSNFVNKNSQLTSFGFGANELSYMFKYKEFRQQFYNKMHPDVPCPDRREFITYLLPFVPVYFNRLKHVHIRLGKMIEFLQMMRHRRINFGNLPIENLELHIDDLPVKVMDFLYQFHKLKKLKLFVYGRINEKMLENSIANAYLFENLKSYHLYILNDEELNDIDKRIIHDMCLMFKEDGGVKHIVIGFEIGRFPIDDDSNLNFLQELALQHQSSLLNSFLENLPENCSIEFKTEIIEVQQFCTENSFVLCAILTKNSV